jgi:hypothetical protein
VARSILEGARVGGSRHHPGKHVAQALFVKHHACPGSAGAVHCDYERSQAAFGVETAVHEVVPPDGGLKAPDAHSFGRLRTLEGADQGPLGDFHDAFADGLRISGGQGGYDPVTPGKGGVLAYSKALCGFAYGEAFHHAQAEVEPKVSAAYATQYAAGKVGEIAGAPRSRCEAEMLAALASTP